MEIKFIGIETELVEFGSLELGAVFECEDFYFIKTETIEIVSALCLNDYSLIWFSDKEKVRRVKATLTIDERG